jgi:hypothetical protein
MNPEEEEKVFRLDYDDVATRLFESLVDLGYAPGEDELLDLADVVMDIYIDLHIQMGGTVDVVIIEDDEEEI